MSQTDKSGIDQFLHSRLAQAPSAMPAGMLAKILAAREKKKRRMFLWLNLTIFVYVLAGAFWWFCCVEQVPIAGKLKSAGISSNEHRNASSPSDQTLSPVVQGEFKSQSPQVAETEVKETRNNGSVNRSGIPNPILKSNTGGEAGTAGTLGTKEEGSTMISPEVPEIPDPEKPWITLNPFRIKRWPVAFLASAFHSWVLWPEDAPKGQPDKNHSPSDSGMSFRLGAGLLVVDERFDATIQSGRQVYVPKFLPGIINQGLETRTGMGFQVNAEWHYKRLWWGGAIQLKKTVLSGTYEYLLDSMPVKDAEGRISGYTALPMPVYVQGTLGFGTADSGRQNAKPSVLSMYIPIQAGYRGHVGPVGYKLGAGILLDLRFAKSLTLPSLEFPYKQSSIQLPKLPVSAQFTGGLFRDFGRFSLGMDAIYRLPDKKGIEVGRDMAIHTTRTAFYLNLSYRIGSK
ncbi:MAG: hypothetical protein JNL57_05135 [Bacteroidetes bacterium]|nr:hypothetical protein [Bacteroidota bacterium]